METSAPESSAESNAESSAAGSGTATDAPAPAAGAEPGGLEGTLAELRKVVWPSRQQLFSESMAVILMVGLSAAAIAAVDRLYHWLSVQVFG